MLIYDALIRLVALLTPIMVFLSFPLAFSIIESLRLIVCQSEKKGISGALSDIIRQLAILILPFTFGVFAATILTINTEQRNWITSETVLRAYHLAGMILFAFLPSVTIGFNSVTEGKQDGVRAVALWVGSLWALLYLSLAAQFFAYLG